MNNLTEKGSSLLQQKPSWLCVLHAGGQWPGTARERTGVVYHRCLSGDAWEQLGNTAAACVRWVGAAPAELELGGGAAEAAAKENRWHSFDLINKMQQALFHRPTSLRMAGRDAMLP